MIEFYFSTRFLQKNSTKIEQCEYLWIALFQKACHPSVTDSNLHEKLCISRILCQSSKWVQKTSYVAYRITKNHNSAMQNQIQLPKPGGTGGTLETRLHSFLGSSAISKNIWLRSLQQMVQKISWLTFGAHLDPKTLSNEIIAKTA